jgi:tRNA A-37 threonylcarbamoyl transferase component Bud32
MDSCIESAEGILSRIVKSKSEFDKNRNIVNNLWAKGSKEIIKYLSCLLKIIFELEKHKIIHIDLDFSNIIKVGEIYKGIDFDLAFTYARTKYNSKSFDNTLNIFKILLSYDPDTKDV